MADQTHVNLPQSYDHTSGKFFTWVDGIPYPTKSRAYNREQLTAMISVGYSAKYQPTRKNGKCDYDCGFVPLNDCPKHGEYMPGEKQYEGMTNAEVAAVRLGEMAAQGNLDAYNMILDRLLGKPKQLQETVTVSTTLQDYLEEMAKRREKEISQIVDVTPQTPNTNGVDFI